MKLKRNVIILLLLITAIIISLVASAYKSNITKYIGENEHWRCVFTVYKNKNRKTGLYEHNLQTQYKLDSLQSSNLNIKLMHGNSEITIVDVRALDGENITSRNFDVSGGNSGESIYTLPIVAYISVDGAECESFVLNPQ